MQSLADEIFILENEKLQPLPNRPLRSGLFGTHLEDALQTLLQNYPEIIPGQQIDPASEDPPRFILLRREMPIGSWSLDHLYVDQKGILTLVETKLIQNPESRREVIGQIIEYAANATDLWASGRARQYATEFWNKKGKDLDDIFFEEFGEELDVENFWDAVETNLKQRRIRLIIAADELRPEVRRMIEYLNQEMQNTEVLGLELKCYGKNDTQVVLVPRLVGQTEAIRQSKEKRQTTHRTTEEEFLTSLSTEIRTFFEDVIQEAKQRDIIDIYWGVKGFSLRLILPDGKKSIFYGYPPGAHNRPTGFIWGEAQYFQNPAYRDKVHNRFLGISGFHKYGEYAAELSLTSETLPFAKQAIQVVWDVAEELSKKPELVLSE